MSSTLIPCSPTCPACKGPLPDDSTGMVRCACGWLCRIVDGAAESYLSAFNGGERRKRKPARRGPNELMRILDAEAAAEGAAR